MLHKYKFVASRKDNHILYESVVSVTNGANIPYPHPHTHTLLTMAKSQTTVSRLVTCKTIFLFLCQGHTLINKTYNKMFLTFALIKLRIKFYQG